MRRLRTRLLSLALAILVIPIAAPDAATPPPPLPPPPASAPAGLGAVGGNARVVLTWHSVEGALGYRVFRAIAGVWDAAPIASTSKPTFTNWSLTNGTLYTYRVAAYNKGGNGPFSNEAAAVAIGAPVNVVAAAGDQRVTLSWPPTPGATSYDLVKSTTWTEESFTALATGLVNPAFVDVGLTNGTKYYYRVRASGPGAVSGWSSTVSTRPVPPPPPAPANLAAVAGNARVTLTWDPVPGATAYRVFATTTGVFDAPAIAKVTTPTYKHYNLTNGTTYAYRVTANNMGGDGPPSAVASAMPVAPPPAVADLAATGGDRAVTLTWSALPQAAAYDVYRSTRAGRYTGLTPIATAVTAIPFVDAVDNGPTFYYTVIARNNGGTSPRSNEASATGEGPALVVDADTTAAFRVLRQTTWGPAPGEVERVKALGVQGFLDEQLAAPPSSYPDTLFTQSLEASQEHFMRLALSGPDQLRQRVAWALHKMWVVSAVEVPSSRAIVTYYRLLMDGAFGNYRDLMRNMTLNPAMGRYLNMLNNRSEAITGVPPNENYPREVMQLFALGTAKLNADGTPVIGPGGTPVPTYTEDDVKALARILTGWTFGDGNPATLPRRLARENYGVPMEVVEAYHDSGAKTLLGQEFAAGQSAAQDLEQAMDVLFNHPNVGPFVSRQLIQQLVTSNPTPAYVADVAAVFNGGDGSARGDLAAVVRAIVMHPEAQATTANAGKLAEPVIFVVSMLRAFNASVVDTPFMADKAEEMGQKVFYPPSVFSYYSPGFRVRGTTSPTGPLVGPEFQILTSVTSLVRVNFVGALLGRYFGSAVTIDYAPFTSIAGDAAVLVDYCNLVFMGGRMAPAARREIINAVRASSGDNVTERMRTAVYLTLAVAESQVDR